MTLFLYLIMGSRKGDFAVEKLRIDDISKKFGTHLAVDSLSLSVQEGEIFGLLGGNGAGKTTTMRMVLNILQPDQGQIYWNGSTSKEPLKILGYLPEERGLYPKIKVSEQILYLARLRGISRGDADQSLKEWLERFQVPEYYNRRVEELSKGNQQKIQFIAAVIHRPEILILDEAFSGLDPVNVELLKEAVKDLRDAGTAVLFSTHRMEHVEELCRNICIMHKSKAVLKGNIKELKRKYPRERVFISTTSPVEGLEQVRGVTSVTYSENGYDIRIEHESNAKDLLQLAMTQSEVLKFEVREPSMNEIFIKSVGENHE